MITGVQQNRPATTWPASPLGNGGVIPGHQHWSPLLVVGQVSLGEEESTSTRMSSIPLPWPLRLLIGCGEEKRLLTSAAHRAHQVTDRLLCMGPCGEGSHRTHTLTLAPIPRDSSASLLPRFLCYQSSNLVPSKPLVTQPNP